MGFDVAGLRAAVARHGRVVRVVIAGLRGSSPREVGAAMLVWPEADGFGQSGTIGGGVLEFGAAGAAREQQAAARLSTHALGPDLGQCCGGAVTLLSEVYDRAAVAALAGNVVVRAVDGAAAMPMGVKRLLALARGQGLVPKAQLLDGWMVEPVHVPARSVWIWGAGHVGRALVQVLAPLPDLAITWVDTAPDRFPELVVSYSHALDLELCDRLLRHGFAFAGLIGSATKWARFRARLATLGHGAGQIGRITCPMGDPGLGKHPQMIAIGVAAQLLHGARQDMIRKDQRA